MKQGKTRSPAMHWRNIRRRSCINIRGQFWTFVTGSISPFVKVVFHSQRATPIDPYHFWFYEIRSEPIGIARVVVVRVAVGVHIAEVIGVVVIGRTLPPIRSGTQAAKEPKTSFTEMHPLKPRLSVFITLEHAREQFVLIVNKLTQLLRHMI